ncbi:hypothetical protein MHYP_G00271060 [Metynnis hypsauchen]
MGRSGGEGVEAKQSLERESKNARANSVITPAAEGTCLIVNSGSRKNCVDGKRPLSPPVFLVPWKRVTQSLCAAQLRLDQCVTVLREHYRCGEM